MKKLLWAAGMLLAASSAHAADSIKVTVGHMCCGGCQAAATAGLKKLEWADNIAIDGTTLTVTAKGDQKVDVVGLLDALRKTGFPAREITAPGPVSITMAHMCCGGCVADLKGKIAEFRSEVLDKDNVKIDLPTRTVTLQPAAGKSLNVVMLLMQLERAGWSASKCMIAGAAQSARR
jgi:copper chaperone CopZ